MAPDGHGAPGVERPWHEIAGDPSAPLAVVVHGSMDRSAGVLRLSRRLDHEFRVLRYDRRGYSRSIAVGPPFTVEANIDDLEQLLLDHRVADEAALVVGHSFGGNVALGLAARRPDLCRAVVVYEAPLPWLEWWPGNSAGAAAMRAADPGDAAEAFMRQLVGDEAWERLPAVNRRERRGDGVAMVAELADLRRAAPWAPHQLDVAVLALAGEHARPHHRAALDHLDSVLPRGRTQVIDHAGHAGPHSHPNAVSAAVFAFLADLDR